MKNVVIILLTFMGLFSNPSFAEKVTIAIGDIEYRAKDSSENKMYRAYGKGSREDTRAFVDMLTTALVKTRKFDVIERDRMAEILKEQGLSMEGVVNGGYEGNSFNLKGVDYILTGAVTEYGETAKAMKVAGFATGKRIASMAVDVRVLDVANGSIGFAETVRAESTGSNSLNVTGFASGGDNSSGALLGKVMRETATNITNLIVSTIYPIKVVAVTKNGDVMLNYGDGYLQDGYQLEIYNQGESFIDPDTGEELGSEEILVGKVSVFSAQAKYSKARITEKTGDIEKGMIARVVSKDKPKKKKAKTKKLW
ncbi:CsgG/HfaB family protein [Microbulbifer discodermiae]|uniref:CsgG/HfaB family protein n=1 Tax=Microbulbifer sp. 2201CG32-9 TaxID=3232309 RepID=UPI00345BEC38